MIENPFVRSAVVTCILNATAGSNRAGQARDEIAALFARNGAQARIVLARKLAARFRTSRAAPWPTAASRWSPAAATAP